MTVDNNSSTRSPGYQIFRINKSYTFLNYTPSQGYPSSFFLSLVILHYQRGLYVFSFSAFCTMLRLYGATLFIVLVSIEIITDFISHIGRSVAEVF